MFSHVEATFFLRQEKVVPWCRSLTRERKFTRRNNRFFLANELCPIVWGQVFNFAISSEGLGEKGAWRKMNKGKKNKSYLVPIWIRMNSRGENGWRWLKTNALSIHKCVSSWANWHLFAGSSGSDRGRMWSGSIGEIAVESLMASMNSFGEKCVP